MTDAVPDHWIRVPVGADAARWATRSRTRTVLFVLHNVTSATRLLDVLPLFDDDLRVQLLATCTESSAFGAGVRELLAETGVPVLPWDQALATPVDLAVSASFGGQLPAIKGQLAVLSHGVGYTKRLGVPGAGCRVPGAGSRERRGGAPVFGLSPQWLLGPDGTPVADALVLSHPEQEERLRAVCPEAAHTGVLAGDPCWDRILAARAHRDRYRRALGVRTGQRLVLLSSTWGPDALFGDGGDDTLPALLPRLTSELPADTHRLAAVLHPNLWHGHGPGQIRSWLDRARRAGLTLIDPLHGWRQALLAADAVIGDHGAVTYYGAALGTPVLLGAAPLSALAPDAPVHAFVRSAPRLDPGAPLRPQLDALLARHRPLPEAAEFVSAVPHEAAPRLRRLFYRLLGLPEPSWPARLAPLPLPPYEPAAPSVPLQVRTRITGPGEVRVERYAGPHPAPYDHAADATHLALHEDTREQDLLGLADVVFRDGATEDPRLGPPAQWCAEVLDRYPQCALAAYVTGPGECVVRVRSGQVVTLRAEGLDPAVCASALHAWLAAGKTLGEIKDSALLLDTGGHRVRVTLR